MESLFKRLTVTPRDGGIHHDVLIDGKPVNGIEHLDVFYSPNEMPIATITLNSVSEIDEKVATEFDFIPDSIDDSLKFLYLQSQFNDEFRQLCLDRINSVLDSHSAEAILDTLLGA